MSSRERDVLKVMSLVLSGKRTQVEAARLLRRSVRQVRRIQRRLEVAGDGGVVHGLRGRRSNHAMDGARASMALSLYRLDYAGFGPTLAAEKLREDHGLAMSPETLRRLLLAAGVWQRKRHRDRHRRRRERRGCFGEMVQADASLHDWLEGRGPLLTLVGMIDDATDRIVCRFFESETTGAYMEVLGRWIGKYGRPASWYSDRHGIFRAEEKVSGYDEKRSVPTQFSRALGELGIELILAGSPQAKGRIERLWGTAQDRLVKELRLAKARTLEEANRVLEATFVPWFNRRCTQKASSPNDAHRPLDPRQDLEAILSIQERRVVGNDYTIRFENRVYQLLPPAYPGLRRGKVIVERRADGSMRVGFKGRYLEYQAVDPRPQAAEEVLGALPPSPRSLPPLPIPAGRGANNRPAAVKAAGRDAVHRAVGRSGRTPAEPCPPAGLVCGSGKASRRPASTHPWRRRACG